MEKKKFLSNLSKIIKKKNLSEKDRIEFDSLNFLELVEFNDINFNGLNFSINKLRKCKSAGELIKLYGNKIK